MDSYKSQGVEVTSQFQISDLKSHDPFYPCPSPEGDKGGGWASRNLKSQKAVAQTSFLLQIASLCLRLRQSAQQWLVWFRPDTSGLPPFPRLDPSASGGLRFLLRKQIWATAPPISNLFPACCLALAIYCISMPSYVFSQDTGIKFVFTIEKFYQDRFEEPMGMFVDKKRKEVYLADSGKSEIFIFDLKGVPVFKFGKAQGVSSPIDLAVKNSLIYLAQEGKSYIDVFNYRGEAVKKVAPPEGMAFSPGRMVFDDDGSLYIVNKDSSVCAVFDAQDRFVRTIGVGLPSLTGVAVSKDRVYLITPFGGRAIRVYDKQGNFIMAFEALQDQGGTLGLPTAATVDKDGLLWLVDSLRGIVIYEPSGRQVARFDQYGDAKGEIFFPVDIDFDAGDMVYITEKGAKRVSVFRR